MEEEEPKEWVYAFVPVGRRRDVLNEVHLRVGRKSGRGGWMRQFHGLNSVEETLLEVHVHDARHSMNELVEILRGHCYFGPDGEDRMQLGGWIEGKLQEDTSIGSYWWRTTYSMQKLREIFRMIAWELTGRIGPAPERGRPGASADAVPVQQAGPEVLVGPVSSELAAHILCGTEIGKDFVDQLHIDSSSSE